MKRSIPFMLSAMMLVVGCGEKTKPSSSVPPIGDKFNKGVEKSNEGAVKKPAAKIG